MLLSASNDGKIILWWLEGGYLNLPPHKLEVISVAFSLDNKFLVTADRSGEGKLWRISDSEGIKPITIKHTAGINKVLFFQNRQFNRQLIATASSDTTIKFWELDGTLLTTFKGHQGGVTAIDFSPSSELFASASEDHTVILWDISELGTLEKLIKQGCMWIKDYLTDRKNPDILKEECGKINSGVKIIDSKFKIYPFTFYLFLKFASIQGNRGSKSL